MWNTIHYLTLRSHTLYFACSPHQYNVGAAMILKRGSRTCTHSDNYKLVCICINKELRRLQKHTSYYDYSLCISHELFSFCIQCSIRQLKINAIQFTSLIPDIMIKIPTAFIHLIRVAPCWDNVGLYDSDVAAPFVAFLLIFDSWHSNAMLSTWLRLLTVICFS